MEPHPPKSNPLPCWDDYEGRIELACMGAVDVAGIPKVAGAGSVIHREGEDWQIMFNGLRLRADGYYGPWMTELIRRLGGHHEPQEERVFHEVVESLSQPAAMIELGAYWGWYSLWFKARHPSAAVVMTEPDPRNLAVAAANAVENQLDVFAELGGVASRADDIGRGHSFSCMPHLAVPALTVSGLMGKYGFDRLDILHADIQGAELSMLADAADLLAKRLIDHLFVSTHWAAVHDACRRLLENHGYHFVAEHTPEESFSFDGLLVARSPDLPPLQTTIHRRHV